VALHHLGRRRVGVGHQQQLAVEQFEVALLVLVDREAEGLGLQVNLDQVGEVGVLDRVMEARLRTRVRQRPSTAARASILRVMSRGVV
jgi:hypothetical protein